MSDQHADRRDASRVKARYGMQVSNTSVRRLAELAAAPKAKKGNR